MIGCSLTAHSAALQHCAYLPFLHPGPRKYFHFACFSNQGFLTLQISPHSLHTAAAYPNRFLRYSFQLSGNSSTFNARRTARISASQTVSPHTAA